MLYGLSQPARTSNWLSGWTGPAPHYRRFVVWQITGAIARRIVCWLKPGDRLRSGEQFGMIKLGSRTELVLPLEPGLEVLTQVGQKVQAGTSPLASFAADDLITVDA